MAHRHAVRYILQAETNDSYIFRQCTLHTNGRIEIPVHAPQMTISKDWNQIFVEKTIHGNGVIFTEEISQAEYDKISQTKDIFPQ